MPSAAHHDWSFAGTLATQGHGDLASRIDVAHPDQGIRVGGGARVWTELGVFRFRCVVGVNRVAPLDSAGLEIGSGEFTEGFASDQ